MLHTLLCVVQKNYIDQGFLFVSLYYTFFLCMIFIKAFKSEKKIKLKRKV